MKSLRKGRSTTKLYKLIGGPYSGLHAYLPDNTMVFSAGGYRGRYCSGRWEDV